MKQASVRAVSIVVPTLNEEGNVAPLVERIDSSMRQHNIDYEIIIVDDHSQDSTGAVIARLAQTYPVRLELKDGPRGKAFSLLQGFGHSQYPVVCMIDADLQYPPDAIAPMYHLLHKEQADVVVTNRASRNTSWFRRVSSTVFNFVFIRSLFGIRYDTQSGLKLFRRQVLEEIEVRPTPWSFDLEFIVRALEKKYAVVSYDIDFAERHSGQAKIRVISASWELAKASVRLWRNSSAPRVRSGYSKSLRLQKNIPVVLFLALGLQVLMVTPVQAHKLDLIPSLVDMQVMITPPGTSVPNVEETLLSPEQPATLPVSPSELTAQTAMVANPSQPTGNVDVTSPNDTGSPEAMPTPVQVTPTEANTQRQGASSAATASTVTAAPDSDVRPTYPIQNERMTTAALQRPESTNNYATIAQAMLAAAACLLVAGLSLMGRARVMAWGHKLRRRYGNAAVS